MSNYLRHYNFGKIVFITIVTFERRPILIENINLIRAALKNIKYNFKIIAGCVLKDHMHLLIEPKNMNDIPFIISFFKQYVSKNMQNQPKQNAIQEKRREKGTWQRRYYDHIIRDENDLNRHLDYIHYNPTKHYNINPCDWQYSSFKKFVKLGMYSEDWCNFKDTNKINMLNLE